MGVNLTTISCKWNRTFLTKLRLKPTSGWSGLKRVDGWAAAPYGDASLDQFQSWFELYNSGTCAFDLFRATP
jgi:hypothetical protein